MKIKVDKNIKPLPYHQRKPPVPEVGNDYYVCLEDHVAHSCIIESIDPREKGKVKFVTIRVRGKSMFGREFHYGVYSDELGLTPEDAMRHMAL